MMLLPVSIWQIYFEFEELFSWHCGDLTGLALTAVNMRRMRITSMEKESGTMGYGT